jgi:hypothetical protein
MMVISINWIILSSLLPEINFEKKQRIHVDTLGKESPWWVSGRIFSTPKDQKESPLLLLVGCSSAAGPGYTPPSSPHSFCKKLVLDLHAGIYFNNRNKIDWWEMYISEPYHHTRAQNKLIINSGYRFDKHDLGIDT